MINTKYFHSEKINLLRKFNELVVKGFLCLRTAFGKALITVEIAPSLPIEYHGDLGVNDKISIEFVNRQSYHT